MSIRGIKLGTVLCASMLVGCVGAQSEDGVEFRMDDDPWALDPSDPGDGDIEVRDADGDDVNVPDSIIWDISGGNVTRQTEPGVFTGEIQVDEGELYDIDPAGSGSENPVCTAVLGNHPKVFKLVEADGTVALTVFKRFVYLGDAEASGNGGSPVQGEIAFSFKKEEIYAGHWSDGILVASASEKIDKSSAIRRLLLGALVAGECASDGLP